MRLSVLHGDADSLRSEAVSIERHFIFTRLDIGIDRSVCSGSRFDGATVVLEQQQAIGDCHVTFITDIAHEHDVDLSGSERILVGLLAA